MAFKALSLLLLLLLLAAPGWPAQCKLFPYHLNEMRHLFFPSEMQATLRTWSTVVLAQYSPATEQLVLLFRTPPFSEKLDKVKFSFGINGETFKLLSLNHTESAYENVTVVTIDKSEVPIQNEFNLYMQLWTYANGELINPRFYSPMTNRCHVTKLGDSSSNGRPTASKLPESLRQLLTQRYGLTVTDDCCLTYVASSSTTSSPPASSQPFPWPLFGLYSLAAAVGLLSILLLIWLTLGLLAQARRFKAVLKSRRQELALQRSLREARYTGLEARQMFGKPYQHLLANCRSVRTKKRMARNAPKEDCVWLV